MKLLLDENLSPRLVEKLKDVFQDIKHVDRIGLGGASDSEVWQHAKDNDYILVSKDSDFYDKSVLFGYPPKVVWIRRGNCSNKTIELILRNKVTVIEAFNDNVEVSFMQLL